jgi:hypothetical protein
VGVFCYKTEKHIFDNLIMKVLQPVQTEQTLLIVPRQYVEANDLQIVLTEDGSKKSETLTGITSTISGNYLSIAVSSAILTEGSMYFLELTQGGTLLYRDKVYCTTQTDTSVKHTLNTNEYDQYQAFPEDQQYITL